LDWQVQPNAGKYTRPRAPTLIMMLAVFVVGQAGNQQAARSLASNLARARKLF